MTGSFILNKDGTALNFLVAFNLCDFATKNIAIIKPIVQPAPPIVAN